MAPREWVSSSLAPADDGRPRFHSVHVDVFDPDDITWQAGLRALDAAGAALPSRWPGRLSLALPLHLTEEICVVPPPDPAREADLHEPPSLYLLEPGYLEGQVNDGEEFRAGVAAPDGLERAHLRFEFASWRDGANKARGGEFANTLWVHFVARDAGT